MLSNRDNRAICVLLGANSGKGNEYEEAARQLGKEIAFNKCKLVYGGSGIGLMGVLANEVLAGGGEVIGIITKQLYDLESAHIDLTKLHVVETMQERKLLMSQLSDACVALPGGLGTLEEIFEFWNAVKLDIYKKPFCLLNINNYYDKLLEFMDYVVGQEFIKDYQLQLIKVADNPKDLIDFIFEEKIENKSKFLRLFA